MPKVQNAKVNATNAKSTGGGVVNDLQQLAVPFGLLLAKKGLEGVLNKKPSAKKSATKSSPGRKAAVGGNATPSTPVSVPPTPPTSMPVAPPAATKVGGKRKGKGKAKKGGSTPAGNTANVNLKKEFAALADMIQKTMSATAVAAKPAGAK